MSTDRESEAARRLAEGRAAVLDGRAVVAHCGKNSVDRALVEWAQQHGSFVYIGRSVRFTDYRTTSQWANPYSVAKHGRDTTLQMYSDHVLPTLSLKPLRGGRVLGCWCSPERCHGDLLAEALNEEGTP